MYATGFRQMVLVLGLIGTGLAGTGCGDDVVEPQGSAPTLVELELSPNDISVGQVSQLQGRALFEDPDGDLRALVIEVRQDGAASLRLPEVVPSLPAGSVAGEINFVLLLQAPLTGPLDVDVWLVDDAGNVSNHVISAIDVHQ